MTHPLAFFCLTVGILALASPAAAQRKKIVAEGQVMAEEHCARCHAVGRRGRSPVKLAPRFVDLNKRYNVDDLEEAFVEGVAVRHGEVEMPEFAFTPDKTTALIAYIKSLAKK